MKAVITGGQPTQNGGAGVVGIINIKIMTDEELIKKIAEMWVKDGGDSDCIESYCYGCKDRIKEEIDKLLAEKENN